MRVLKSFDVNESFLQTIRWLRLRETVPSKIMSGPES